MPIIIGGKDRAFRRAIHKNDMALMKALFKISDWETGWAATRDGSYKGITPEMALFIIEGMNVDVVVNWQLSAKGSNVVFAKMLCSVLEEARPDVARVIVDAKSIDLKTLSSYEQPLDYLMKSPISVEDKLALLPNLLRPAFEAGKDAQDIMMTVAKGGNNPEFLKVLKAFDYNLHGNNQMLLRSLAKLGHKEMCLCLMQEPQADIHFAARMLRGENEVVAAEFLEDVAHKSHIKITVPTVESLSQDVSELRQAMGEILDYVRAEKAGKKIVKTVQAAPSTLGKKGQ